MTDKQTIIDGIDVSGCLFYYDNGKCSAILGDDACKDWHNCSYKLQKQLKRKEQECEELKDELLTTKCMVTTQGMQYGRLHEQLVQLKEQLEAYKMEAEEGYEINAELKAKNEELKKTCDILALKQKRDFSDYQFQNNELKQQLVQLKAENERLQEEREKAKTYNLEYGQLLIKATNNNNKLKQTLAEIKEIMTTALEQNTLINLDKILQKINEVENGNI